MLQKLASFAGIHEAGAEEHVTEYAQGAHVFEPNPRLFILNRGSVAVFGTERLAQKLRYKPLDLERSSRREARRLEDEESHDAMGRVLRTLARRAPSAGAAPRMPSLEERPPAAAARSPSVERPTGQESDFTNPEPLSRDHAAGGASVAVMATGIEQIYPRRHRQLGEQLSQAGCLVTEYPPGSQPLREHFPRRNRIISGLSLGVLVVEAALPSGSLITAGTALEQGREVFTLPWSIYHPGGRGCLRLLRDGATQVQEVDDIVQQLASLVQLQRALSLPEPPAEERQQRPARKDRQSQAPDQVLLTLIGDATIGVDELAAHSRLPPSQVMALLSSLELEGQVERSAGGYSRSTGS